MHLSHEEKARLIDGKVNEEERKIFLKHLAECEECFEILSDSVKLLEIIKIPEEKLFLMVIFKRKKYISLLALGILFILLPLIWTTIPGKFFTHQDIKWNEIHVERGKTQEISLPDGTQVYLDSGSHFRYPPSFVGKTRKVLLSGEAYFHVSKNEIKEFSVIANHAEIKVVGTKFNVKAWQNTNQVAVAVVEGKIYFGSKDGNQDGKVLISKDQVSVLGKNGPPTMPRHTQIVNHLQWMDRNLSYENIHLREILAQIERWYKVEFILCEKIDTSELITIHASQKTVERIVQLLADICGFTYEIHGQKVYLNFKENDNREKIRQ